MCSPCQSGAVNYCQTVTPPATGEDGQFDWVLEAARRGVPPQSMAVPLAASISECCETTTHPETGAQMTTCDVEQGCGWVSGEFLSDQKSCKFTTEGATFATHEDCLAVTPGAGPVGPAGTHVDWFPQCAEGQTEACYYPDVDTCLPAIFNRPRAAGAQKAAGACPFAAQAAAQNGACPFAAQAAAQNGACPFAGAMRGGAQNGSCSAYVCDGRQAIDAAGRVSFPRSACQCIP